jgi:UDP-GlcNAc:undecaprenyl-phosphate GlcNAc-1-phosphate transferase
MQGAQEAPPVNGEASMIAPVVVAFVVTLGATPAITSLLAHFGVLDRPNRRSSHDRLTPRGGGVAVAAGVVAAALVSGDISGVHLRSLLLASLLFGLLGLIEDLKGIAALPRLGLQAGIAALCLVPLLDGLSGPAPWQLVFATGVAMWLVGFVNVFNFMDGINGIAAAQAIIAGVAFALVSNSQDLDVIAVAGAIVAASAAGFVPFNFPHARIFLGDVGSYFLGAWLAVLVVMGLRAGLPVEVVFAPVSLYLADTSVTLVRRVRRGATWYEAHREHVYQQLVVRGWSHSLTTAVVTAFIACCSALGAVSTGSSNTARAAADAAIVVLLSFYLVLPAAIDRRLIRSLA